jgi:HPt (histidine-containing phosphotransfer) domain-containing protein
MTAHATRGFEERCLAAGMDSYLSKPIDAPRLIELLESFAMEQFPAKAQAPMASTEHPPGTLLESVPTANDAAPSLPFEDSLPNNVDLEGALERMDGNRELLADMANFFLEDSPDLLDRIQQGLANSQAKNVQHAAHALKGLASNFGAARTVHLAKTIEHLAGDEDLASVSKFMPELERCVEELSQSLKTISV